MLCKPSLFAASLMPRRDTPSVVAINEAIELAKLYSDDDVKNMINGVLDKIYKSKVDSHE